MVKEWKIGLRAVAPLFKSILKIDYFAERLFSESMNWLPAME
jgi:hypothetical protein